jgi:GT2 family glycosyltransferase
MSRPLISVNLLLFKPDFYLEPCLESILAQSYENIEILIIDNNSGDGTAQKAREIIEKAQVLGKKIPPYKIIALEKNLGFAGGQNLGIKESRGDLLILVNQDIILETDCIKNIVESFDDEKVGSAQGKILRLKAENKNLLKTQIIDTAGLVMLKNRRIIARGQGREDNGQFNLPEEIFGADGSLPVYRRTALEDIKIYLDGKEEYFDEDFFAYKEDVDVAWRLRLYGWQTVYKPKSTAWHARTSGDSAQTNYFGIIKERLKISKFGKYQSFKNQRLVQIKNEQPGLLLKHLPYFLFKEISAWIFVILFEHYTWRAIRDLFSQAPQAWRKRKIIMEKKKVSSREMAKWFI